MKWNIEWSPLAEQDLRNIPWRTAARVDATMMALAADCDVEALVERPSLDDAFRFRVRLRGATALLWVDSRERVLHVTRVFSNS